MVTCMSLRERAGQGSLSFKTDRCGGRDNDPSVADYALCTASEPLRGRAADAARLLGSADELSLL